MPDVPQVENLRYGVQGATLRRLVVVHPTPHGAGLLRCEASSTGFQPVPDVPQVENLRTGWQGATLLLRADDQFFFWRFQVWPAL